MISSIDSTCSSSAMMSSMSVANSGDYSQIADSLFSTMDANGDGIVDKAELSSVLTTMSAGGAQMPSADDLFSKLDANGDGQITKDENNTGMTSLLQQYGRVSGGKHGGHHHRVNVDEMFAKADTNGDGSIDKSELSAALASMPKSQNGNGPNVDNLFSKLDANGDGVISKDELNAGMQAMHHHQGQNPAGGNTDASGNSLFSSFVSSVLQQYQNNTLDPSSLDTGSMLSLTA